MTTKKPKTRKPPPDPKTMARLRRKIIDKFAATAMQMEGVASSLNYYIDRGCGSDLGTLATLTIERIGYCVQRCRYLIEARINTVSLDTMIGTLEDVCREWGEACRYREEFSMVAREAYEEHKKHLEEEAPASN